MNPSFTAFVTWPGRKGALFLDKVPAPSDPEAGPFLITSSKTVLWVERSFPGGFLRVAVRKADPNALFKDLVEAIATRGEESEWGNVVDASHRGMSKAIDHLHYYGFKDLELLHGKGFKPTDVVAIPASYVEWMPEGWGVLLPKDRNYVGTTYDLGEGVVGVVVHNASRGVAILK